MKIRNSYAFALAMLLLVCTIAIFTFNTAQAQAGNIKNDVFWYTKDGRPINSQGGGIFKFPDPITVS
jgi:lipopolysaccharide export LptBFGC system permease protein LptF